MRQQERAFGKHTVEKKAAFLKRLRKTAMGLPASLVSRAVKDSSPALSIQSHVLYVHAVEAPSRLGQGRGASVAKQIF